MNVLCIGNSFSQDATRYLHQVAKFDGENINTFNLYIGGCPLQQHYDNVMADARNYKLFFNGVNTGFDFSIKEALTSRRWNYITLQQASHKSTNYENYQPYLEKINEYVKEYAPDAKILIHQTWAYKEGSDRLVNYLGYDSHENMFYDVKKAYESAIKDTKPYGVLPSGELIYALLKVGVQNLHRDDIHLSLGIGRYAVALLWYRMLTGNDISNNKFNDFDVPVSYADICEAKRAIITLAEKYSFR